MLSIIFTLVFLFLILLHLGPWQRGSFALSITCLMVLLIILTVISKPFVNFEIVGMLIVLTIVIFSNTSFLHQLSLATFFTASLLYLFKLDFLGSKLIISAIILLVSIFIKEGVYEKIYKN